MDLEIRVLAFGDIDPLVAAFNGVGWHKPASLFEGYLREQDLGARVALVALADSEMAGYVTVSWQPRYAPLREAGIPEIQDLNVLPAFRRKGIATRLLDEAEVRIAERSQRAGIGVGLYADYGAAQRLYVLRGYMPDGRGVTWHDTPLPPGSPVTLDDALVLHLEKTVRSRESRVER